MGKAMASKTDDILAFFERTTEQFFSRDELREKLKSGKKLRIKYGVDVTAPTLHIGHAVNLWLMRYLQDKGHKVVFLIGDFTTRIGDPTGRSETRPVISREEIDANAAKFVEQAKMVLRFDDPKLIEVRRNSEWYDKMPVQELMNLLAMVTHARLISRDMFQLRIAEGKEIHMHEMIYPVLQGYDSVMVQSDLAIIGSDQMFNEMMGRFFQEKRGQKPQTVVTTTITPGTDGRHKQSKSLGNYIGLGHSPRDKFGRVMSIPDDLIDAYLRVYTDIPLSEIDRWAEDKDLSPRDLKMKLAYAIVGRYHGHEAAVAERDWFVNTFSKGKVPDDIPTLGVYEPRLTVLELVALARKGKSKSDCRRLIKQGGVELNHEKLTHPDDPLVVKTNDILKTGKRSWFRIEVMELHQLETERLQIRPMLQKDIDFLQKYIPQWDMAKYMGRLPAGKKVAEDVTREVFRKIIMKPEPKDEWVWKISLKSDPEKIVGVAHLRRDSARGNENIWLDPALHDDQLMHEAMSAISEYAFNELGFNQMMFKDAFAHAAASHDIEHLQQTFMAIDASIRNRDDPAGVWGFTKEGWEYMKEQIRRGGSSDISLMAEDKRASSRFARRLARDKEAFEMKLNAEKTRQEKIAQAYEEDRKEADFALKVAEEKAAHAREQLKQAAAPKQPDPLPSYLQPPSPKPGGVK